MKSHKKRIIEQMQEPDFHFGLIESSEGRVFNKWNFGLGVLWHLADELTPFIIHQPQKNKQKKPPLNIKNQPTKKRPKQK
jgi:hypothetical protein